MHSRVVNGRSSTRKTSPISTLRSGVALVRSAHHERNNLALRGSGGVLHVDRLDRLAVQDRHRTVDLGVSPSLWEDDDDGDALIAQAAHKVGSWAESLSLRRRWARRDEQTHRGYHLDGLLFTPSVPNARCYVSFSATPGPFGAVIVPVDQKTSAGLSAQEDVFCDRNWVARWMMPIPRASESA